MNSAEARVATRFLSRKGYSPPIGDMTGYKTYVSPETQKVEESTENANEESRSYVAPAQSKRRTRGLPKPSEHPAGNDGQEGRVRHKPQISFNTPDAESKDQGATKVPIRTKGKPGEEYGHPYKLNVYPRRTASEDLEYSDAEELEVTAAADINPTFPRKRQHKQRGEARRKSKQYYRRNKFKIKRNVKKWYRRNRRNPLLKRRRKLYHKYPTRFKRKNTGGNISPAERSQEYREEHKTASVTRVVELYLERLLLIG